MFNKKRCKEAFLHSKEVPFARGIEYTSARSAMILPSVGNAKKFPEKRDPVLARSFYVYFKALLGSPVRGVS